MLHTPLLHSLFLLQAVSNFLPPVLPLEVLLEPFEMDTLPSAQVSPVFDDWQGPKPDPSPLHCF